MLNMEKHWILIDRAKRKELIKFAYYRRIYRSFLLNSYISRKLKIIIKIKYNKFHRLSSISTQKTRCLSSGRSYGVLSNFKLSRFVVRRLAHKGDLSGLRRSSW